MMRRLALVITCLLHLITTRVSAEPQVIYDAGRTVPTERYRSFFSAAGMPEFRDFKNAWLFKALPPDEKTVAEETADIFPILTTRLSPRRLYQEQESYFPVMTFPLCILGTDDLSRAWLARNQRHLVQMNAQCLLVAAESAQAARALAGLAPNLMIYPANGDAVADYFKIAHYPVLITDRYVSQ